MLYITLYLYHCHGPPFARSRLNCKSQLVPQQGHEVPLAPRKVYTPAEKGGLCDMTGSLRTTARNTNYIILNNLKQSLKLKQLYLKQYFNGCPIHTEQVLPFILKLPAHICVSCGVFARDILLLYFTLTSGVTSVTPQQSNY